MYKNLKNTMYTDQKYANKQRPQEFYEKRPLRNKNTTYVNNKSDRYIYINEKYILCLYLISIIIIINSYC